MSQVSTSTLARAATTAITITGFNFSGAVVTASAGLHVTAQQTGVDALTPTITVDATAALGAGTITIQTPHGTTEVPIKRIVGPGANGIQTVYRSGDGVIPGPVSGFTGTSGRFRVTRTSGGVITTYADTGSGFQTHLPPTGMMSGDVVVSLVLLGPSGSSVRFDNFVVNSGTGLCLDD